MLNLQINDGQYVCGVVKGTREQIWKNQQGKDFILGISIIRPDDYGQPKEHVFEIKVMRDEIQRIAQQVSGLIGHRVLVGYMAIPRKYNNNSWTEHFFGRESFIYPLDDK